MATIEKEQLPSFDVLRDANNPPDLSPEMQRVFWTIDGPLSESIWIMESCHNTDSLEPYFKADDPKERWHPVSQAPLTDPKVSSITVRVYELDKWEDDWYDFHREHSDPNGGNEQFDENGDLMVRWGELLDYDEEKDEEGKPEHLLMCCGTTRPRGKAGSMAVKPTTGDFITVHDYLSTLHPWLLGKRDDILALMGLFDDKPLPQETKLMVGYEMGDSLTVYDRAEWIEYRQRKPGK
ncbi:hypothetical protein F4805DRAFT_55120 [Annulohypoxylon moriforme]|nr:hypothetical protein F4805DRAFT_55120 [Annulohypoxylon moriforme]